MKLSLTYFIMKTLNSILILLCLAPTLLNAKTYYCRDSGSAELDMFGSERRDKTSVESYQWIVDTNRGWKRSDVVAYSGTCEIDNGYTVCKADTPFGEAIFSIHPDDSNFILIYLDYGIDLLAFVGSCDKT